MESLTDQLEALYESSYKQLYHCALSVTTCGGLAEDAIHNAFQRTFRLETCPDNLRAYLFRSVRNAAIDLMRREGRSVPFTPDMMFECEPEQGGYVERQELLELVNAALVHLSEDERETVVQYLIAQLTFQEIADLRERPLGTVTSWYRRGLKKLKAHLDNEERPN